MPATPYPVSFHLSDLHLDEETPVARAEENYYKVMANYLHQWNMLVSGLSIPSFVAGDLFHRYNPSPRLINFAIGNIPSKTFAIPGQHDLPYHNYHDVKGSAFGTLNLGGFINPGVYWPGLNVHHDYVHQYWADKTDVQPRFMITTGLAWRDDPVNDIMKVSKSYMSSPLRVAYTHEYCWSGTHRFMNADKNYAQQRADLLWERYKQHGYTHVFCGDNHKGFIDGQVGNTGTFIRRRLDEMNYKPFGIILYSDGSMKQHFWDTSKDQFVIEPQQLEELKMTDASLERVIQTLQTTLDVSHDYVENLRREGNRQRAGVKAFINKVLDEIK